MADRGTAILSPTPADKLVTAYVPVSAGGSSGPAVPTVGVIFPSGNA